MVRDHNGSIGAAYPLAIDHGMGRYRRHAWLKADLTPDRVAPAAQKDLAAFCSTLVPQHQAPAGSLTMGAQFQNWYQVGDRVTWTSQAAGITKPKTGTVVAVVLPKGEPNDALKAAGVRGRIRHPGYPRDHVTYVVRAGGRLYWPRVDYLAAASA